MFSVSKKKKINLGLNPLEFRQTRTILVEIFLAEVCHKSETQGQTEGLFIMVPCL